MAENESEDSSDGILVIDEPNYECNKNETLKNSNSDMKVIIDNSIENISSVLYSPSSSTKNGLTCKHCSRIFSTNNNLLNHIRKFKGSCSKMTNFKLLTKNEKGDNISCESFIKKKRGRPPKKSTTIKTPVPEAIPLYSQVIPLVYNPTPSVNSMPSLRQILVDDIEPEYPCNTCGQIFRHNIGLICHINTEHINVSTNEVINVGKKSKIKSSKKPVKVYKQVENNEPISDTINLTLLPDLKKDSLLNRMKSYVYNANKDQAICVLCNLEFKNTKRALAHVEDKHITEKIECVYCKMKFVYELKLRSHMAKRHKVICVLKCDKCLKLINRDEIDSHSEKCKELNLTQIKIEDNK